MPIRAANPVSALVGRARIASTKLNPPTTRFLHATFVSELCKFIFSTNRLGLVVRTLSFHLRNAGSNPAGGAFLPLRCFTTTSASVSTIFTRLTVFVDRTFLCSPCCTLLSNTQSRHNNSYHKDHKTQNYQTQKNTHNLTHCHTRVYTHQPNPTSPALDHHHCFKYTAASPHQQLPWPNRTRRLPTKQETLGSSPSGSCFLRAFLLFNLTPKTTTIHIPPNKYPHNSQQIQPPSHQKRNQHLSLAHVT
jgi:hypothetical protein